MIALSSPLDTVWQRLDAVFQRLATEVQAVQPHVSWTSGHHATESFPLTAFVSFSRNGRKEDEDVVVSVSAHISGNTLAMSSDIARGDGYVLADGPEAAYPIDLAPEELAERGTVLAAAIETFLHEHIDTISDELSM